MKRFLQFIGLTTCIFAVGYGIFYFKENSQVFNEVLKFTGFITISGIIIFVTLRSIWGDKWLIKGGNAFLFGQDLIESIANFLEESPNPNKETIANLTGHLVYRFTRLGVLGFLLTLIPILLLWQQNRLFEYQNVKISEQTKLFYKQNEAIITQTNLFYSQDSVFKLQTNYIQDQTDLSRQQTKQITEQNNLIKQQIKQSDTEIEYLDARFKQESAMYEAWRARNPGYWNF